MKRLSLKMVSFKTKLELIEEHSEDEGGLTIHRQGEYVDLCRGPHVPSTGRIQSSTF